MLKRSLSSSWTLAKNKDEALGYYFVSWSGLEVSIPARNCVGIRRKAEEGSLAEC